MDEVNKEEVKRVEESLEGYYTEKRLQERKIKALKVKQECVVKHPMKVKPDYAYEELDAYWKAQSELHTIAFEEEIYKTNKILTTIVETIPSIEKALERLKGEDNE